MKKILYFIIAFIVGFIIAYFVIINLPKASSKNKTAEFTVTAPQLYTEFAQNEKAANRKYIGKTVEVSGKIIETEKDKQGSTVLYLDANQEISSVLATLEKSQKGGNLNAGANVSLKCQCSGYLQDVVLNKCVITSE